MGLLSLVVTDVLALIPPWLVKEAIDSLPSLTSARQLFSYLLAILAVVAGQGFFRFVWRRSLFGVSRRVEYLLRNDFFRHLQGLDRSFFLRRPIGDLLSRSTNDLVAIQEVIAYFGLLVVDSSLTIVTCLALMALIDPLLTLGALLPMPLLSLSFFYFGRRVRRKSAEVQAELAGLTQLVQETLAGVRLIQTYTLEAVRRAQYQSAAEKYIRKNLDLARIRGIFYALLTFLAGLAAVIVLWAGGARVHQGHLTLGGFVAFNSYLTMLLWPMMSVGFMVNLLQRGRASLDRLEEIFRQRPSVIEARHPLRLSRPRGEIRFEGVRFHHPESERWALRDVTLMIPGGMKVGITGPVGSGKSTLLELIPRVFDPIAGRILMDGVDLRELAIKDLRRWVAWVAQEPFLFSDSIRANISFQTAGRSSSEVESAARLARLDRDEDAFAEGWETLVGERGVMISGGQRQRIALARAIASDPRVLLLDDAFAHLDESTESEVFENILAELPQATILFVSHRVSSLMKAERVVVLEGGRVREAGPPGEIMQSSEYFRRILQQQQLLSELERLAERERR